MKSIRAKYVDIFNQSIYPAEIIIENNRIKSIIKLKNDEGINKYILPGFVDAHIHIESSMLTPSFFAAEAIKQGTIATVSDPHEIANVCGRYGIDFMISNALTSPLKVAFGAPSCVPATKFETSGAQITSDDIKELMQNEHIYYLAEVMNFPGVINDDASLLQMIKHAQLANKPVDGHAPQLRMPDILQYFPKGISTDHECVDIHEAKEKLSIGCKILIREGSAAKNYNALSPLIHDYSDQLMFCSDDKHPDELILGHINQLVKRAISDGYPLFNVLKMACINPVLHYNLPVGLLREGDVADFILVKDLNDFEIKENWIEGECVFSENKIHFSPISQEPINHFERTEPITESELKIHIETNQDGTEVNVISAIDGQLITESFSQLLKIKNGIIQNDIENDILKCVVVNRYKNQAPVSIAFIKNFGLKKGAIVSSIAHDSHNIIAVGVDDLSISKAINAIIETKGGIAYADENETHLIPLEIGGLMTQKDATLLAEEYISLNKIVKENGCKLHAPFMTLSFMALPVIPKVKITDLGIFDVEKFDFISLIKK